VKGKIKMDLASCFMRDVIVSVIFPFLCDVEVARLSFMCSGLKQRVYTYFMTRKDRNLFVDDSQPVNASKLAAWPPLPYFNEISIANLWVDDSTKTVSLPVFAATHISLELWGNWTTRLELIVADAASLKGEIVSPLWADEALVKIVLLNKDKSEISHATLASGAFWTKDTNDMPGVFLFDDDSSDDEFNRFHDDMEEEEGPNLDLPVIEELKHPRDGEQEDGDENKRMRLEIE
jgi:hypothetical protein